MIFNSITYLIFLCFTVGLYWMLPKTSRLWLIFLASAAFYGFWRPEFLAVMFISSVTDYFVALRIESSESMKARKMWLGVSLFVNLGLLFYFKYLFFIVDNAGIILNLFGINTNIPLMNIILPLGISFYTFETISYVVDVYRGFIPAERSFVMYACFVTFFPKLIAGPVLRAAEMLPQFSIRNSFKLEVFLSGLQRILFGLFLKVVIADNIAPLVDEGFMQPVRSLSAIDILTLAYLFGFQIYFDFSGYSSIAIGSARLMGMHIPENFNFPYMAISPRDFWHRWHISLSSWIRDYLYFPLMGLKVHDRSAGGVPIDAGLKNKRTWHPMVALFLTWGVMGLWHGANWTFVLWGMYHAILIAAYRLLLKPLSVLPNFVRVWGGWIITLPLIMLGWIFFRSQSVSYALEMLLKLTSPSDYLWLGMRENTYLITGLLLLLITLAFTIHSQSKHLETKNIWITFLFKTLSISIAFTLVFVFLRPISQFIYFQF